MNAREQLLCVADAFCDAESIAEKTLSARVFDDGKKLAAIRAGGDLVTARFEAAMRWLSDNWPEDAVWPEGVMRPVAVPPAPQGDGPEAQP